LRPSRQCNRGAPLVTRAADHGRSVVIRNVRVFDAPRAALLDGTLLDRHPTH
jgi:hypothetical protein